MKFRDNDMRKQDYLPALIASLEANEKRYFKIFSRLQPGEKRYLKLFDALERCVKYEAVSLCAEMGVEPKQLADDKYYLTQTLLQSLRNYDQETNEMAILRNMKENVQSLINRRLFGFAIDMVEKALERAQQLEAFELVDSLLLLRSSCYQNLNMLPKGKDMTTFHSANAGMMNEVMTLTELRGLARNLETKGADASAFRKIIHHPLIRGGTKKLKSLRAQSLRFAVLSHYYSSSLKDFELLRLSRQEFQWYAEHTAIKIINPIAYLTNMMRVAAGEQDFEVREQFVNRLQQELDNPAIKISPQRRKSIYWSSQLMSLWNLRFMYRFKEALTKAERCYSELPALSEYEQFSVAFEYALILLHNKKEKEAADIIEALMRFKSDTRSDVQPFVRLLYIMVHLQLENFEIISSKIKAARFWFKKAKVGNREISIFLKHAGNIAKSALDRRTAWEKLLHEVQNGQLPEITRLLQFDAWVKQRLLEA